MYYLHIVTLISFSPILIPWILSFDLIATDKNSWHVRLGNWLFQPLTLSNQSEIAMLLLLIRFYTRSDKHFIQEQKIELPNTFPNPPSLCCILLQLQRFHWGKPLKTTLLLCKRKNHFSTLFQSLVARHLHKVCWKWTLLGSTSRVVPQISWRLDLKRIKQHGICKG